MRPGRLALAFLLGAHVAAAEGADTAALAGRAAEQCEAGDLDGAAATLEQLESDLGAELGPQHSATLIARLNRAHVERARGHEKRAKQLEQLGESKDDVKTPSKLKRALRGLRVCATARPVKQADTSFDHVTFDQHLKVARTLVAQGKYRRARDSTESARATLGEHPSAEARMRLNETAALVNIALGDNRRALEAADAADAIAKKRGVIDLRITLARLTAQAGDLEHAGAALDEIEKSATSERDRAELAEARGDLAIRLGSPRRASAYLETALAGHRKAYGEDHRSTAAVYQLQGDAYRMAGDFPAATSAYRKALKARRTSLGPKHPETARTQNAIGVLEADLGDWQSANRTFGAALASLSESLGADHPETITVRANRALAHWGNSKSAEAAEEYAEVVDALAAALGEDHPSVASAIGNLSRMEFERGNLAKATALLERALAAQRRSLGNDHPALATTRLARGRLLAYGGKLDEAGSEIDGAIGVLTKTLGPEHPVVARARTLRARVAVAQGDRAVALREALAASQAIATHTRRTFGAISDRQRSLLAEDSQGVIGALLSVPQAPAKDVYISLLPHRDSVLRSIAAGHAAGGGGRYMRQLASLRERYVAAVVGTGPDTAKKVQSIADAIDGLEALAAAEGTPAAAADPAETFAAACQRLPANAALVKFVAYDRTRKGSAETRPAHAALVVRGGDCRTARIDLGDSAPIEEAAEAFATGMRQQRSDMPDARKELSRLLLAPLGPAVEGAERWFVVPDGSLWGIPIGALPDPKNPDQYLFERITVGYLTSTFELAQSRPGGAGEDALAKSLLIGAPDFGGMDAGGPIVLTATGPCQIPPFEDLPATRGEIDDISDVIGSKQLLTGADVTKQQLESRLKKKPWLIHFATHAYFAGLGGCHLEKQSQDGIGGSEPIAPNPLLLSGIVLAGANRPTRVESEGQSGILTAYEVAGLDLRSAGLVVLSACDTGTGLQKRGQEVQGLRWGFRAAGARALVTSLWRSNDAATRRMMHAFYTALASEDVARDAFRGAEALRQAQLSLIANEKRLGIRQPLIWANFIFSGVL